MYFYVTVGAYSTLGHIQVSASVRELRPIGEPEELYTISTVIDDAGESDPQEYLRSALSGLMEAIYDDTPRTASTWGVPGGLL